MASGEAVIPLNIHHGNAHPVGVGRMFTTKINANLGRSVTHSGKGDELEKLAIALKAGADFVMDLSVGSDDLKSIRQGMLDASDRPLGTDPDWDRQFALCLDPGRAKSRWLKTRAFTDEAHGDDHCSMCGKQFCAVRTSRRIRKLASQIQKIFSFVPLRK